jgi:hypothetical protein
MNTFKNKLDGKLKKIYPSNKKNEMINEFVHNKNK